MDLNKVQIIGRTTQEVELKQTPNGDNVATISIATSRNWTDKSGIRQESTEFHNVVLWGKLAEIAGQYLKKGKQVYIEGRLQTRSWEAQDGTKRYKTEIVGENLILLGSPDKDNISNESAPSFDSEPKIKKTVSKQEEEISIEDIPF